MAILLPKDFNNPGWRFGQNPYQKNNDEFYNTSIKFILFGFFGLFFLCVFYSFYTGCKKKSVDNNKENFALNKIEDGLGEVLNPSLQTNI